MSNRLATILTIDELNRLRIKYSQDSEICIIADVHGMKCCQAKRFINNIINTVRTAFQLIIILGYSHGTAIKDMLSLNFTNMHIAEKHADPYNQGVTHMLIAS